MQEKLKHVFFCSCSIHIYIYILFFNTVLQNPIIFQLHLWANANILMHDFTCDFWDNLPSEKEHIFDKQFCFFFHSTLLRGVKFIVWFDHYLTVGHIFLMFFFEFSKPKKTQNKKWLGTPNTIFVRIWYTVQLLALKRALGPFSL